MSSNSKDKKTNSSGKKPKSQISKYSLQPSELLKYKKKRIPQVNKNLEFNEPSSNQHYSIGVNQNTSIKSNVNLTYAKVQYIKREQLFNDKKITSPNLYQIDLYNEIDSEEKIKSLPNQNQNFNQNLNEILYSNYSKCNYNENIKNNNLYQDDNDDEYEEIKGAKNEKFNNGYCGNQVGQDEINNVNLNNLNNVVASSIDNYSYNFDYNDARSVVAKNWIENNKVCKNVNSNTNINSYIIDRDFGSTDEKSLILDYDKNVSFCLKGNNKPRWKNELLFESLKNFEILFSNVDVIKRRLKEIKIEQGANLNIIQERINKEINNKNEINEKSDVDLNQSDKIQKINNIEKVEISLNEEIDLKESTKGNNAIHKNNYKCKGPNEAGNSSSHELETCNNNNNNNNKNSNQIDTNSLLNKPNGSELNLPDIMNENTNDQINTDINQNQINIEIKNNTQAVLKNKTKNINIENDDEEEDEQEEPENKQINDDSQTNPDKITIDSLQKRTNLPLKSKYYLFTYNEKSDVLLEETNMILSYPTLLEYYKSFLTKSNSNSKSTFYPPILIDQKTFNKILLSISAKNIKRSKTEFFSFIASDYKQIKCADFSLSPTKEVAPFDSYLLRKENIERLKYVVSRKIIGKTNKNRRIKEIFDIEYDEPFYDQLSTRKLWNTFNKICNKVNDIICIEGKDYNLNNDDEYNKMCEIMDALVKSKKISKKFEEIGINTLLNKGQFDKNTLSVQEKLNNISLNYCKRKFNIIEVCLGVNKIELLGAENNVNDKNKYEPWVYDKNIFILNNNTHFHDISDDSNIFNMSFNSKSEKEPQYKYSSMYNNLPAFTISGSKSLKSEKLKEQLKICNKVDDFILLKQNKLRIFDNKILSKFTIDQISLTFKIKEFEKEKLNKVNSGYISFNSSKLNKFTNDKLEQSSFDFTIDQISLASFKIKEFEKEKLDKVNNGYLSFNSSKLNKFTNDKLDQSSIDPINYLGKNKNDEEPEKQMEDKSTNASFDSLRQEIIEEYKKEKINSFDIFNIDEFSLINKNINNKINIDNICKKWNKENLPNRVWHYEITGTLYDDNDYITNRKFKENELEIQSKLNIIQIEGTKNINKIEECTDNIINLNENEDFINEDTFPKLKSVNKPKNKPNINIDSIHTEQINITNNKQITNSITNSYMKNISNTYINNVSTSQNKILTSNTVSTNINNTVSTSVNNNINRKNITKEITTKKKNVFANNEVKEDNKLNKEITNLKYKCYNIENKSNQKQNVVSKSDEKFKLSNSAIENNIIRINAESLEDFPRPLPDNIKEKVLQTQAEIDKVKNELFRSLNLRIQSDENSPCDKDKGKNYFSNFENKNVGLKNKKKKTNVDKNKNNKSVNAGSNKLNADEDELQIRSVNGNNRNDKLNIAVNNKSNNNNNKTGMSNSSNKTKKKVCEYNSNSNSNYNYVDRSFNFPIYTKTLGVQNVKTGNNNLNLSQSGNEE